MFNALVAPVSMQCFLRARLTEVVQLLDMAVDCRIPKVNHVGWPEGCHGSVAVVFTGGPKNEGFVDRGCEVAWI